MALNQWNISWISNPINYLCTCTCLRSFCIFSRIRIIFILSKKGFDLQDVQRKRISSMWFLRIKDLRRWLPMVNIYPILFWFLTRNLFVRLQRLNLHIYSFGYLYCCLCFSVVRFLFVVIMEGIEFRSRWRVAIKCLDPLTKKLWEPNDRERVCHLHFVASDYRETPE